jgi:hypothetical protein
MKRIYITVAELMDKSTREVSFRTSAGLFTNKRAAKKDMVGGLSEDGKLKASEVGALECFCVPASIVRAAYDELYPRDDEGGADDFETVDPSPEDHGVEVPLAFAELIERL